MSTVGRPVIYDRGGAASTINGILKDHFIRDQIQDAVNRSTFMLSQITARESTHGRQFVFPVQFGVSQGVGARGENIILPDPGFGEYLQAFGTVKYLYSTLYITGQAIASTQGRTAAFRDALETAIRDARDGMTLDLQRQVWGDGTGVLGRVTAASTGTTITVSDPYGLTYIQADLDNSERTRLFRRNMNIFIAGSNTYARVTGVNANGTITVNAPTTVAVGNLIYRGDATGRTSVNNEITGITGLVRSTGTYLSIPREGNPEWQSNIFQVGSGAGGAITESGMRIALDQADIIGQGAPELIVTNHKTRRRFEALLQQQRRFVNPMKLEGGFSALEYDGLPMMVDKDAPPQRMWFLRPSDMHWMMMHDVDWMDRDGEVLSRVDDKDAYKAVLFTYRELITTRPAAQSVIFDITSAA